MVTIAKPNPDPCSEPQPGPLRGRRSPRPQFCPDLSEAGVYCKGKIETGTFGNPGNLTRGTLTRRGAVKKKASVVSKRKTIKEKHRRPVDLLTVIGDCCWRVVDRSGNFCDFFKPGESRKPTVNIIATVESAECSVLPQC